MSAPAAAAALPLPHICLCLPAGALGLISLQTVTAGAKLQKPGSAEVLTPSLSFPMTLGKPFIRWFVRSFINSFVRSFILSFVSVSQSVSHPTNIHEAPTAK